MCIPLGKRFAEKCAELVTDSGERLRWVDRCRYLGYLTPSLEETGRCASEPVVLSLLRSKCMPILLYAVEAYGHMSYEFTLTRIFMKLFRTGSSKVVSECQVSF